MSKVICPTGNQVYFSILRPFSAENFHKLDVCEALQEIGYSQTEIKRLLKTNAVKIWDTRITEDGRHFEWYKRPSGQFELMEKNINNCLLIGKHRALIIYPTYVNPFKRFWWRIRPYVERYLTDKIRYDLLKQDP